MVATATARSLCGLLHDLTDEELLVLTASDNRSALKAFLAERAKQMWHQTSYDESLGLVPLIKRALGPKNASNINSDITPERFPLNGTGVRSVKCRVEAYLDGEIRKEAAKRLTDEGHILGSTGHLAGFLHDHPDEVKKWNWVDAIAEDSRWADSVGCVLVPCAGVAGAHRSFFLSVFGLQLNSSGGVLVVLPGE